MANSISKDVASADVPRTKIHLIAHTHWDREWYSAFEVYRARLLELMDTLLGILASESEYTSFQLDGQTSMVEDYLELRPEKREVVCRFIFEGSLLPGPWYTQPDEFLASGESLIRNLMVGIRMARAWGRFMPVGYLPDSFGHISQMPQLLRGFGIEWALVGRGVKLEGDAARTHRFHWRSPDGSSVLTLNIAYGNGLAQSTLPKDAEEEIAHIRHVIEDWEAGEDILLFHGVDHIQPREGLPALIADTNERLGGARVIHSTLPAYFSEIAPKETPCVIEGELRDKRTGLLEGTLSTCMNVKVENASTVLLLERMAEPLATLAWLEGMPYPSALLGQAWKYVLQNHAHDSICACSIDEVVEDVLQRFRWAQEIGATVVHKSLKSLAQGADVPGSGKTETHVGVFNTLGYKRTGPVRAAIDFAPDRDVEDVRIFDSNGDEVPHQVFWKGDREVFVIRPHITPRLIKVKRFQVAFVAREISSMGSALYRVVPVGKSGWTELAGAAGSYSRSTQRAIGSAPNRMENEHLMVVIEHDGTLTITVKERGEVFRRQLFFEDSREAGDVYNHVPPLSDRIVTNLGQAAGVALVENGPVYATCEVRTSIPGVCSLVSYVTLVNGARRVDIVTEVDNVASEHRLRAVFSLGERASFSRADGQFDVNERQIKRAGMDEVEAAKLADCHPMESFVDVEGARRGLAIIAKGLPEYEAYGDDETLVALTLIRSVRRGPYDIPVRGAQMLGTHRFEYTIFPHAAGAKAWELVREALDHHVPLRTAQRGDQAPDTPGCTSLFRVEPAGLVLSAFKRSEDGKALVVRLFNIQESPVEGRFVFQRRKPTRAFLVDLNEEHGVEIECGYDGDLVFPVRGKGIVTLKLFFPGRGSA